MATTERYTTVIELNSEQAKRNLDELRKKVEAWKSDLAEAREKKMGRSFITSIQKELRAAEKELKKYDNEVARTIDTMNDLQSASVERIEAATKSLKRLAAEVPRDSEFSKQLNSQLEMVTQELENIKATKAFEQLQRDAAGATRSLELTKAEAQFVKQTVENIDTASLKQLKMAEQTARGIKESARQGTEEYDKAAANLSAIQGKLSDIDAKERKIVTLTDQYNRAMIAIGKETKVVNNETELIERTLKNLSSASIRDVEFSLKALKEELQDMERSGKGVEETTENIKKLNEELKKVQDMQSPSQNKKGLFSRGIDFMNKNWGALTQIIAAYTGLRYVVTGCTDDFAQMDQEMANVRKYTGQASEEVGRMNEDFKGMDTRTLREQLNQLAGSAGRLGITSTAAVEEFVDGADKINVALGDDLGDGAVDQIGKLAMAFGEDDKKGLRGAMLATGSAVNELAQNSSAGAGYLVEYTARLSGVGIQAGLTQAQIMGFGAVMDENMQKDEMAATALSQIITKMTTDSEIFARIAGKNVEEFSNLVKTDMNAALMQFFETMNTKGGFTELAPLFEQMGLDGTRAVGVLSTLANKIDDVRKHQTLATEAYEKGTSVLDEFNVQNETYQAKLDKNRKRFTDLRIELGEKLLPVTSVAISTTSMMVKVLSVLASFVTNNWKTLLVLTTGIVSYTVAVKAAALWESRRIAGTMMANAVDKISAALTAAKTAALAAEATMIDLITGKVSLATVAQNLWNKVMLSNPYVAFAATLMALVSTILAFVSSTDKATKAQKRLNEIQKEATATTEGERAELEALVATARNKALADDTRREALRQLQEKYPGYLQNLRLEEINSQKAKTAIDNLTQSLIEEAKARILVKKIQEAEEKKAELDEEYFSGISGMWHSFVAGFGSGINDIADKTERMFNVIKYQSTDAWNAQTWIEEQGYAIDSAVYLMNNYKAAVAEVDGEIKGLNDELKKTVTTQAQLKSNNPLNETEEKTGVGSAPSNYDTHSYWEAELKARREKLKALRDDAKATAADIEKAAQAVKEAEDKMETFTGAKASAKQQQASARQQRIEDKTRREHERKADDAAKAETEQQLAELTHRYAMGKILYCDYIDEQERIQLEGIERRMLIYKTESLEYQKLNRQREELLLNGSEESQRLTLTQMRHAHEQRLAVIEETTWRENMTEQQKNEMVFRETMRFLDEQRILYRQGTLERINLEQDIEDTQHQHQLQSEQYYQQQLETVRSQYLGKADERAEELALKNLDDLHARGKLSEIEYQEALLAIKAQYAGYETSSEHDQRVGAAALQVARNNARQQLDDKGSSTANLPIIGDIMLYKSTMEQLKQMYADDEITHAQYLAAKQQATSQFCEDLAQKFQAAYQAVNQIMSAASSYYSAQQEYETAMVQKKYEKQIEAAGNNQRKVKKLQEKQAKEEAAIKNKYNKKAMAIQIAQAMASTAMNALSAFGAVLQPTQPWTVPLAYAAAAAATASGMLQIAAIKKQHAAEEAGYYEGGFTGGSRYRREAGVVHEGEFVANHQAVNNPAILPVLNFLDQAQRNNTVGSLTAQDVSRNVGAPSAIVAPVAPIINVTTDNEALRQALEAQQETTAALLDRLSEPIEAQMVMHDFDRDYKRYQKLLKNK